MYNHYIPQSDGSFRRSSVPEPNRRPQKPPTPPPQPSPPPKPEPEAPCPPPPPKHQEPCPPPQSQPLQFLRRLLPKELDISDLIIIGLLLLLSDSEDSEDLSPLLTIALYFIL